MDSLHENGAQARSIKIALQTGIKHMKPSAREAIMGYVFLTPTVIGFLLFVAYPFFPSIYYSLTDWPGSGAANFVGLENYTYMFLKDPSSANRYASPFTTYCSLRR